MISNKILSWMLLITLSVFKVSASAQILIDDGENTASPKRKLGRSAATDYFQKREEAEDEVDTQKSYKKNESSTNKRSVESSDRILMLHMGRFINDKAYRWGSQNKVVEPGQSMFGVTYRVGEWSRSMDLYFRAEMISYDIDKETPLKLSVMPIIAFPDVRSNFPLYFGAGVGPGIFFKQAGEESDLSLDYALLIGSRFASLFDWGGLFLETGLKGHIHLLSSGQHDGVFLAGGTVFSF